MKIFHFSTGNMNTGRMQTQYACLSYLDYSFSLSIFLEKEKGFQTYAYLIKKIAATKIPTKVTYLGTKAK